MSSNNLPLISWYAFCGLVGILIYKKKRWLGGLIGLVLALALITIFALLMGG